MALTQHRLPICSNLKDSLQSFVLKRLKNTNQSIDVKNIWLKKETKNELTPTEIERINARRLQNKQSAKKSRQKSKTRVELLEREFYQLQKQNETLKNEIQRLKKHISDSRTEILKNK
ncbi:hypothetical protein LOTGIDRAFT_232401 [Lottia gigantea]|uniref:BZIP domain-containing protein n=1 Tax=Lottia gigantea TaxID=225164 RepID=V3ZRS2_LOTGI|nr:hypothetical protein LOTGIDRAFT_232401 [Lottia gigantea]ESO94123.1 hypothetical protein LOTGIDRAFT_232401 [Lottia gigantea]